MRRLVDGSTDAQHPLLADDRHASSDGTGPTAADADAETGARSLTLNAFAIEKLGYTFKRSHGINLY